MLIASRDNAEKKRVLSMSSRKISAGKLIHKVVKELWRRVVGCVKDRIGTFRWSKCLKGLNYGLFIYLFLVKCSSLFCSLQEDQTGTANGPEAIGGDTEKKAAEEQ